MFKSFLWDSRYLPRTEGGFLLEPSHLLDVEGKVMKRDWQVAVKCNSCKRNTNHRVIRCESGKNMNIGCKDCNLSLTVEVKVSKITSSIMDISIAEYHYTSY